MLEEQNRPVGGRRAQGILKKAEPRRAEPPVMARLVLGERVEGDEARLIEDMQPLHEAALIGRIREGRADGARASWLPSSGITGIGSPASSARRHS